MGRPSKLTAERQKILVQRISEGNTVETACAFCNLNPDTFYDWMKRGAKPDSVFSEFSDAIRKARAEAESWHIANITTHAEKSWAASAWWLERSNPDRWALRRPEEKPSAVQPIVALEPNTNIPKELVKAAFIEYLKENPKANEQIIARAEAMRR
jgi:hypothetical protein